MVNDMYYVDKKVSTWKHSQPHGSSSRICDAADLIDGIELEDLSNYWEFDMVVKDEKRLQTFRFVVSKKQLQKRKSVTVRKNFADPDAGFFQMDYFPARGNKPARWELTDPQDGSHSGRDGCKLVVKEATWKSWIDFYPIFTSILIAVLIGIFACVRRFDCSKINHLNTVALWVVLQWYYAQDDCEDPLTDCPTFSNFKLAYRMCCREQLWRWFTYSLMHSNIQHIASNLVMLVILTAPLEMVHGSWRVMILYVVGAIAGSLGSSMFDPSANVVGASGACYMYLGAWCADMASNFDTKDSVWACCNGGVCFSVNTAGKYIQIVVVAIWVFADLGMQVYNRYTTESNVSFAGHFCGFGAGVAFGTFILKNDSQTATELYLRWSGISIYLAGMILAIVWNVYYTYDPYRACDDDTYAKCNLTKNYAI